MEFLRVVFAILLAFTTLLGFTLLSYHLPQLYTSKNFTPQEKELYISHIIGYLDGKPLSHELQGQMTQEEIIHMQDVAALMSSARKIFGLLVLACIAFCAYFYWDETLAFSLRKASVLAALLLIALSITVLPLFSWFFIKFHEVIFKNEYWLLPHDSFLIQLFPQSTFVLMFSVTLISAIATLLVISVGAAYNEGKKIKRKARA